MVYAGPIIDAHHHFWKLAKPAYYPWLQDRYDDKMFLGDYRKITHDFLPDQYLELTKSLTIKATVHIEAERSRDQELAETFFLQGLRDRTPLFPAAVVAHAQLASPNLSAALKDQLATGLVRGIRSKPLTRPTPTADLDRVDGSLFDVQWQCGLALLETYGLSWDLRVPWWHLEDAALVLQDFPGLQVALNHCGLPLDRSTAGIDGWRAGMERLAELPNVFVKLSELGIPENRWDRQSNQQIIRETLDLFGYGRCMFATNLPVSLVCAPDVLSIVECFDEPLADASSAELSAFYFDNAAKFYKIDFAVT